MTDTADTPPARRVSAGPRRSQAASDAILDAAEALLAEAGYGGFSIEQVAKRAGAGKPTIYRWWPSKVALLLAVYARHTPHMEQRETGTLEGDLAQMIDGLWRFWRETPAGGAFRSIIAEAQSDPAAMAALTRFMAERRRQVAEAFERAARRGELRGDVDLDTALDMLSGYAWGRLLTGRINDDPAAIRQAARQITQGALKAG